MQNQKIRIIRKLALLSCLAFLCLKALPVFAQVPSVTTVQDLTFGAFTRGGNGGTVTVSSQGERSATGSVILLNLGESYHPALFDVTAPAGTIISITNGPDVNLQGSNGGTMNLHVESSYPASPLIADPSGISRISIGGTLSVGDAATSPPGSYTGTFDIIFNNQ